VIARVREALRRRARRIDPALRPVRRYRFECRVEDLGASDRARLRRLLAALPNASVQWDPPAAGPEIEVAFEVLSTTRENAEAQGRRLIARTGRTVLAARAHRVVTLRSVSS
jgi:hypothetical protein